MTAARSNKARRETVALTRQQVESICHDMGLEREDAVSFWRLAKRETRDPGCLNHERSAYFAKFVQ